MSLQICLNCREMGITWHIDDENRTWWYCSLRQFEIEEDESKECCCGNFNIPLPTISWLMKNGEGFYRCFSCNQKTDQVKEDTNNYKDWIKLLNKIS